MNIRKLERGAALLVALSAVAGAAFLASATAARAASPILVTAKADPGVKAAEEESGSDHDAYVGFTLAGAHKGSKYRLVVQSNPGSTTAKPCNPGLTTSFTGGTAAGKVAFPLEPVTTGHYFPFAGQEPCHGRYVIAVQEQPQSGRFQRVRTFAFSYPSLKITYLANGS